MIVSVRALLILINVTSRANKAAHNSPEPICANQIRVHVDRVPSEVIDYCHKKNILVEAYSPLGVERLLENETIKEIARKYRLGTNMLDRAEAKVF